MGYINATTELVVAFSNFAWPLTLIGMVVWFRKSIAELFGVIKRQINLGASVKYGDLELNGIKIENAQIPFLGFKMSIRNRESSTQDAIVAFAI